MDMINFDGLLIGIVTFLIIGLFHPVVVKAEYYWGTKCWWIFLVLGILGVIASLFIDRRSVCRKVGSLEIRKENTLGTIVR